MSAPDAPRLCRRAACRKPFNAKRAWHVYCSRECREKDWLESNPRVKRSELERLRQLVGSSEQAAG